MPTYDYICRACGGREEDVWYGTWRDREQVRTCPTCGKQEAVQDFSGSRNFIHPSLSSLYGKPQAALGGDVIEDYAHKQRLMKELGLQESNDAVGGSKNFRKEKPPKPSNAAMAWMDDAPAAHL